MQRTETYYGEPTVKTSKSTFRVFQDYASYYDLFYEEKDYRKESQYALDLLKKYLKKSPRSILDVGCGTGGHALLWASRGISVTGIDRSQQMLDQATRKAKGKKLPVEFKRGDVRNFQLGKKFDAVTSMFAVMSYQTSYNDLVKAFQCVRAHLPKGGVFLFDAWFGPGVLTDPPGDRVKIFRHKNHEVIRTVKSVHHIDEQVIDVHYDILVLNKSQLVTRIKEVHPMHYFFPREVQMLASATGFKFLDCHPFLEEKHKVSAPDWNATFVLRGT